MPQTLPIELTARRYKSRYSLSGEAFEHGHTDTETPGRDLGESRRGSRALRQSFITFLTHRSSTQDVLAALSGQVRSSSWITQQFVTVHSMGLQHSIAALVG